MSRSQFLAAFAVMSLALVVSALTGVFSVRVAATAAEGSDLRGGESIWVDATLSELEGTATAFARGTRVMREVQPGIRAVAVVRGPWRDVPLHAGRPPVDQGEAVVGTRQGRVGDVLDIDGRRATVVGSLGLRPTSRLADDVVIVERDFFPASPTRLRLDGPGVEARYRAAFPGNSIERVEGGTNDRTNVDSVSPLLIGTSAVVAGIVALSTAVFVARCEARRNRLLRVVGRAQPRLLVLTALRFGGLLLAAATLACTVGVVVAVSNHVLVSVLEWMLPCAALSVVGAAVAGRGRSWS